MHILQVYIILLLQNRIFWIYWAQAALWHDFLIALMLQRPLQVFIRFFSLTIHEIHEMIGSIKIICIDTKQQNDFLWAMVFFCYYL